jgi:oligoribonuclease
MIAWIDLETTGLSLDCGICEVAAVVTDEQYYVKDRYHRVVSVDKSSRRQTTAIEMHKRSGLWSEVEQQGIGISWVDLEVSSMLASWSKGKPMILGGSSVHFDRGFIEKYMPATNRLLHYRNLDVSSVKIFVANATGIPTEELPPKKSDTKHRAMDDILESLNALKTYQEYLDVKLLVDNLG